MLPSDGVPALVASIREHKKFKQLANYSIECLSKVRWELRFQASKRRSNALEEGAGADCSTCLCVGSFVLLLVLLLVLWERR